MVLDIEDRLEIYVSAIFVEVGQSSFVEILRSSGDSNISIARISFYVLVKLWSNVPFGEITIYFSAPLCGALRAYVGSLPETTLSRVPFS